MENYISYTSVNIQAQPCFATLHILVGRDWKWELDDLLNMILLNVKDFIHNFSHTPIWCNTKRFILVLNIHGQTTTINIS